MFGPMLFMSILSLFLLIPRHGGRDGPKGNWIRRPRRGLPCWITDNIYKLYCQCLQYLQFTGSTGQSRPRCPSPRCFWSRAPFVSFFGIVFVLLFLRFWYQLCSNLASNLDPKSTQHGSKSHPKSIPNRILFLITLLIALLIDFWSHSDRLSQPRSTKNRPNINRKVNPTGQQPK